MKPHVISKRGSGRQSQKFRKTLLLSLYHRQGLSQSKSVWTVAPQRKSSWCRRGFFGEPSARGIP